MASADIVVAEEVLKNAAHLMVPEDQTQRRAFEALMPWMYVLRNRGFSWAQLTSLLAECGFKLQPSTVRTYYSEMLASRLDVCQARMNEQLALLDEIRKETRGADLPAIAGRVSTVLAEQRRRAESKVNTLFGAGPPQGHPRPEPSHGQDAESSATVVSRDRYLQTTPARAPRDKSPTRTSTADRTTPDVQRAPRMSARPSTGETSTATASENRGQSGHEGASLTRASPPQGPSTRAQPAQYKCLQLHRGVIPVKKRDGVPEEVYKPGDLEHPAIPGLYLNLNERTYGAALEYQDMETGEILTESPNAKRFRLTWRKQVPKVSTRTDSAFVKMDPSVFRRLPGSGANGAD